MLQIRAYLHTFPCQPGNLHHLAHHCTSTHRAFIPNNGLRYSYTRSPPLENAASLTGTPQNSYTIPRDLHCPGRPKTHPAQQRSQNKRKVEDPARYDTPGPGQTGDPPLPSCHHTPPYPENPKKNHYRRGSSLSLPIPLPSAAFPFSATTSATRRIHHFIIDSSPVVSRGKSDPHDVVFKP